MTEESQHDETPLPEDAVEDLAPEDADDVSGGAVDAFMKIEVTDSSQKVAPEVSSFQWGVG